MLNLTTVIIHISARIEMIAFLLIWKVVGYAAQGGEWGVNGGCKQWLIDKGIRRGGDGGGDSSPNR